MSHFLLGIMSRKRRRALIEILLLTFLEKDIATLTVILF